MKKKEHQNKSLIKKDLNILQDIKGEVEDVKEDVEDVKEKVGEVKGIVVEKSIVMIPFIPPEILTKYKKIDPSLIDFFKDQITTQRNHRFSIETKSSNTQNFIQKFGIIAGFIISLVVIIGSFILIGSGLSAEGIAMLIASFVSIISISVYGIRQKKKNNKYKEKIDKLKELADNIRNTKGD